MRLRRPACKQASNCTCRRDSGLAWSVTNRGEATLWVFVAPPIGDRMAKENALAIDVSGDVVLAKKFIRKDVGDHPYLVGAIALAAGESFDGLVPLGSPHDNLVRLSAQPLRWLTVSLEVGYAERAPTDRVFKEGEFLLVIPFRIERQQIVKTPPIRWR